ncbi:MAG: type II toxin-antitoxin system RelE/ParE family toxin [Lachnospiraceae bacterium]|nr:type II toxin-antitoxin system RelE/ParE family toxin [Lachnospiraceae bacterium]
MGYRIVETEAFKKSLNEIFDYISVNFKNPNIIRDMLNILDDVSELLKIFPDMYSVFEPSYKLENIVRKFPVKNYLVFYTVNDYLEEVRFLKIIHSRRNYYKVNYLSNS